MANVISGVLGHTEAQYRENPRMQSTNRAGKVLWFLVNKALPIFALRATKDVAGALAKKGAWSRLKSRATIQVRGVEVANVQF